MHTTTRRIIGISAASLVLAVGAPWTAVCAADPATPRPEHTDRDREKTGRALCEFHTAAHLLGMSAANANGEVVGEVEDFIFDRGLGQLEYALVKSGGVLGLGGKTIVVRYDRLGYDASEERFRLDMTKEQVDRAAEFVPEDWRDLGKTSWADELDTLLSGDDQRAERPNSGVTPEALGAASEERIKGEIASVHRKRSIMSDEQTVVTIRTESGETREVVLGPSWYVMGHSAAPMRGDSIDATTRVIRANGAETRIATAAKIDGASIPLRDKNLHPQWRVERTENPGSQHQDRASASGSGRLMLLSDLIGAKAMALDQESGSVQSVVVERRSGRIVLIGFDPNENFLGLGDTIRCVPWPVVSVRNDDVVVIDASTQMLQTCEPMPDDVAVFAAPARLDATYRVFEIEVDRFEPLDGKGHGSGVPGASGDSFGWLDAARHGKEKSFKGQMAGSREAALVPGEPEVRVITVQVSEKPVGVILGPVWYVERQRLSLRDNEPVTVAGREVTINGTSYVLAKTITHPDGTTVHLWDGNLPAWASR
jgi:sporulation protein YlmC with PRC-barrel domain